MFQLSKICGQLAKLWYHIIMIKHSIRYFNNKQVRAVWDNDNSIWWYSAVDFIEVIIEPNSSRRYWNNVKVRNPELSSFCGQLKLYAGDNKKYLSNVINENGVRQLLTIIPSKYKKEIQDWMSGILDPLDAQSKRKAYQLYKTELIHEEEIGKTISLQKIQGYLFEGLYPFAGQIRTKTLFCLIDQLRRNIFMKKRYTMMFFTILLTGCGKVNMVKGICLEVDVCPSTYIYYETLEKIKVSESAILETTSLI